MWNNVWYSISKNNQTKVAIITEADEHIATGHLKESIVLVEELEKCLCAAALWINEDIPKQFLTGILKEYCMYQRPIYKGIDDVLSFMKKENINIIIFNLREIANDLIKKVKNAGMIEILCIDEFGHRRLDCDIIVNPMIDKYYGKYEGGYKQLLIGNQYLILPPQYYEWHKKNKVIHKNIEKITISMGGVDRNNTTQKIVGWMQASNLDSIEVYVVLGGGYAWEQELRQNVKRENIHIFRNINFLDELFWDSDLAFCAGGNTLHELACMGTPAVVIPSMPHEYRNGKAFEAKGFGKCYQDFTEFEKDVSNAFFYLFNYEKRLAQMKAGKSCSDGGGYLRMVDLIKNLRVS